MATISKCPECGSELMWGFCESCEREIPEGQEIIEQVAPVGHPWIVRGQGQSEPKTYKSWRNGENMDKPIITDDRLYTS